MTKRRGMSLIELVVGMGITIVLTTLLTMTWVAGSQDFTQLNAKQESNSTFLDTFSRVNGYVRQAIEFPTSYTDAATNTAYSTADGKTLIMKFYMIKNSNGQVDCTQFDYIIVKHETNLSVREIIIPDPDSIRKRSDRIIYPDAKQLTFTQVKLAGKHRQVTMEMRAAQPQPSLPDLYYKQVMVARND